MASANGIRLRCRTLIGASYMLMNGLALALLSGQELLIAHFPDSPWRKRLIVADAAILIWMLVVAWEASDSQGGPVISRESKFTALVAICVVGVVSWVKMPLAAGVAGVAFAVLFLGVGWMRGRRYYGAVAGWWLGGAAVMTLSSRVVGSEQFTLFLLLGGIATAMQGGWELMRFLNRPLPDSGSAQSLPG